MPSLSLDGQTVVFVSERDGNQEIYSMNVDGTNQTRLTNDAAADFNPSFSRDGTKILFDSERTGNAEVFVMASDGQNPVNLSVSAQTDGAAKFSPAGTQIVFHSNRTGQFEIWAMDSDGGRQFPLTDGADSFDAFPSYSPNGAKIVYNSKIGADDSEIFVMNVDGSSQAPLTNNLEPDSNAEYSPDGLKIVFEGLRAGNWDIWLMDAAGGNEVNLTNDSGNDTEPSAGT